MAENNSFKAEIIVCLLMFVLTALFQCVRVEFRLGGGTAGPRFRLQMRLLPSGTDAVKRKVLG